MVCHVEQSETSLRYEKKNALRFFTSLRSFRMTGQNVMLSKAKYLLRYGKNDVRFFTSLRSLRMTGWCVMLSGAKYLLRYGKNDVRFFTSLRSLRMTGRVSC